MDLSCALSSTQALMQAECTGWGRARSSGHGNVLLRLSQLMAGRGNPMAFCCRLEACPPTCVRDSAFKPPCYPTPTNARQIHCRRCRCKSAQSFVSICPLTQLMWCGLQELKEEGKAHAAAEPSGRPSEGTVPPPLASGGRRRSRTRSRSPSRRHRSRHDDEERERRPRRDDDRDRWRDRDRGRCDARGKGGRWILSAAMQPSRFWRFRPWKQCSGVLHAHPRLGGAHCSWRIASTSWGE